MTILTNEQVTGATNQQRIEHIMWASRSMGSTIPRFGPDGKQNGETSVNIEAAWNATNFARVNGQLAAVLEAVNQLATAQGTSLDLGAIKQAAKDGVEEALAEGIVKVDVTVQGQEQVNG